MSTFLSTDGVLVDQTPPVITGEWFLDGFNVDRNRDFFSDGVIRATWKFGFFDGESFIDHFEVSVNRTDTGAGIFGVEFWGKSDVLVLEDLPLEHNVKYRVEVTAVNGAGVRASFQTLGSLYDTTAPETEAATVIDGSVAMGPIRFTGVDLAWTSSVQTIYGTWEGFVDPESDIRHYDVNALDEDMLPLAEWHRIPRGEGTGGVVTPGLFHGRQYFFAVRATNFAQNTSLLVSDGVYVDLTPPVITLPTGVLVNGVPSRLMGDPEQNITAVWAASDPESDVRVCASLGLCGEHETHSVTHDFMCGRTVRFACAAIAWAATLGRMTSQTGSTCRPATLPRLPSAPLGS